MVVLADAAAETGVALAAAGVVVPLMPGRLVLVAAEQSTAPQHRLQAVPGGQSA